MQTMTETIFQASYLLRILTKNDKNQC